MGTGRIPWSYAPAQVPAAFSDFDEGPSLALDAVVPSAAARDVASSFAGERLLAADPWATTAWAFPAQGLLESGRAPAGGVVATTDPHALELGAFGVAALHQTPAPLWSSLRDGRFQHAPVRRVRVEVASLFPARVDPVDAALSLVGGPSWGDAVVSWTGPGVDALDMPGRRRLLAAFAETGCLGAFTPDDEVRRGEERRLGRPAQGEAQPEAGAWGDVLRVDVASLAPLALGPGDVAALPLSRLAVDVKQVRIGGCVGGDLATLEACVARLEGAAAASSVSLHLVPASEALWWVAKRSGLEERAAEAGARVSAPHEIPDVAGTVLTTSPCLAPRGLMVNPFVCVQAAQTGVLAARQGAP